ncbi:hypothetical protein N7510_011527 [Penicillium lagena]|uniref:uncharacterized protein n=1 Tax=Penicillium lagena TaxID=94218 RepID=UPI002541241A|nr:uncharacterized protein N7510_011527 [Penicillium lagena]KAJ5601993.1 hypothetical protein N7510_011527 [Penicillium lagena]
MARVKQGVFSWEDVLAQRYQSEFTLFVRFYLSFPMDFPGNKPPPLPRTPRVPSPPQPQPQSRLLARLSPELRLMIWEFVLGGHKLHIIQRGGRRLGHVVCPDEESCEICHGNGIAQPVKEAGPVFSRPGRDNILALPLACRQMYVPSAILSWVAYSLYFVPTYRPSLRYSESIHLLYSLNTFEFSIPWTLPYLRPAIPRAHWTSIRDVELRWSFPGHWLPSKDPVRAVYVSAGRAQWLETCRTVRRLPALKSFVLVLASTWFCEPVEKLAVFLDPLKEILAHKHIHNPIYGLVDDTTFCSEDELLLLDSDVEHDSDSSGSYRWRSSPSSLSSLSLSLDDAPSKNEDLRCCNDDSLCIWELRLQGQSYYGHELKHVEEDLRRRGIGCWISAV